MKVRSKSREALAWSQGRGGPGPGVRFLHRTRRPSLARLQAFGPELLGLHTAIGAGQALLALSWKNPVGVAIGASCALLGKKVPFLQTAAGLLIAIRAFR